jgi:thymidylate kinase
MEQPKQFIIEGIDRMGKSSLIKGLLDELGYHLVIHYSKPELLKCYANYKTPLRRYQFELYNQMFRMIESQENVIFDRGHLGELVYAPMYRKYQPDFVKQFEKQFNTTTARLVLLTTSDFSFLVDDGLSLDFSKKEEEQAKFVEAFNASRIEDKVLVNVCNGRGGYREAKSILDEVLKR